MDGLDVPDAIEAVRHEVIEGHVRTQQPQEILHDGIIICVHGGLDPRWALALDGYNNSLRRDQPEAGEGDGLLDSGPHLLVQHCVLCQFDEVHVVNLHLKHHSVADESGGRGRRRGDSYSSGDPQHEGLQLGIPEVIHPRLRL